MDTKFILLVLVIYNVVQLNTACDRTSRICAKYCEIEHSKCNGLKHPLCTKLDATDLEPLHNPIKILNLTTSDVRNTVLFEINRFRNDLAFGHVTNHIGAANLHVVKWSFELQEILEAQLKYKNVCNLISSDDTEFVGFSKFEAHRKNDFYSVTELSNQIKASYDKIKWNPLIMAEFSQIGCVMTEEESSYALNCLTNSKYSVNMTIDPLNAYATGYICTSCKCSSHWVGLCDDDASTTKLEYGNDDTLIVLYIMIGVVIVLALIIIVVVCLFWLCIECISKTDESGTYTLRHKYYSKPRDTLHEKEQG